MSSLAKRIWRTTIGHPHGIIARMRCEHNECEYNMSIPPKRCTIVLPNLHEFTECNIIVRCKHCHKKLVKYNKYITPLAPLKEWMSCEEYIKLINGLDNLSKK